MSSDPSGVGQSLANLQPRTGTTATQGFFLMGEEFLKPIWHFRPTGLDDFSNTRSVWQQNCNEFSVLSVIGRVGKVVALALLGI
jgi:hypothetical protein